MENNSLKSVTIIGYGRLGALFHRSLMSVGITEIQIVKKNEWPDRLNQLVLICVPDSEIEVVSAKIANTFKGLTNQVIIHCSGTVGLSVLHKLEQKGATVGCIHPLMAVSEATTSFNNVTFDVCGSATFIGFAKSLIHLLDADMVVVEEDQKKKLHIASVVASNYLVTLMHLAQEIADSDSQNQESLKPALLSLMQSAVNNLEKSSPKEALTGPIARGDVETVSDHIELLKKHHSKNLDLYKILGKATVDMLGDRITQKEKNALIELFDES
ncbi:MAG: DUF2520 domain-containing protein [Balneolaceae bacterium]|nr:DUF2520 domain-containing protein [Balneolaceae bacterium]